MALRGALEREDLAALDGRLVALTVGTQDFEIRPAAETWRKLFGGDKPQPWSRDGKSVTLTPASTDTDGFFFCAMERKA